MAERLDVRRMLLRRGWTEAQLGVIRKNGAVWSVVNDAGDSFLDGPARGGKGRAFAAEFTGNVPARVIVAACEAAASQEHPVAAPARGGEER